MKEDLKRKLIKYFQSIGIEVCTDTNARGNKGYFSDNKIEISKTINKRKFVPTLLHEFSHYIHQKLEPNMVKTGGSLEVLFDLDAKMQRCKDAKCHCEEKQSFDEAIQEKSYSPFKEELFKVTNFVDKSSSCNVLKSYKDKLSNKIVKLKQKKSRTNQAFCNIQTELKAVQKEKTRICRCINKYQKYYSTPTELFARFVEGLYIDCEKVKTVAPRAYRRFLNLLKNGYYFELKSVFEIIHQTIF